MERDPRVGLVFCRGVEFQGGEEKGVCQWRITAMKTVATAASKQARSWPLVGWRRPPMIVNKAFGIA
jgi:hypothetical protein